MHGGSSLCLSSRDSNKVGRDHILGPQVSRPWSPEHNTELGWSSGLAAGTQQVCDEGQLSGCKRVLLSLSEMPGLFIPSVIG